MNEKNKNKAQCSADTDAHPKSAQWEWEKPQDIPECKGNGKIIVFFFGIYFHYFLALMQNR